MYTHGLFRAGIFSIPLEINMVEVNDSKLSKIINPRLHILEMEFSFKRTTSGIESEMNFYYNLKLGVKHGNMKAFILWVACTYFPYIDEKYFHNIMFEILYVKEIKPLLQRTLYSNSHN